MCDLLCRCKCGNCVVMPTVTECGCCCEIDKVVQKIQNNPIRVNCITQHEGFNAVCLNRWVLRTSFYQFRQSHGSQIPVENDATHRYVSVQLEIMLCELMIHYRKYRFIAYRQLTWWCWGWLGKQVRVCLPSCAVEKIRDAFPSDQYTGFKYPKLGSN